MAVKSIKVAPREQQEQKKNIGRTGLHVKIQRNIINMLVKMIAVVAALLLPTVVSLQLTTEHVYSLFEKPSIELQAKDVHVTPGKCVSGMNGECNHNYTMTAFVSRCV